MKSVAHLRKGNGQKTTPAFISRRRKKLYLVLSFFVQKPIPFFGFRFDPLPISQENNTKVLFLSCPGTIILFFLGGNLGMSPCHQKKQPLLLSSDLPLTLSLFPPPLPLVERPGWINIGNNKTGKERGGKTRLCPNCFFFVFVFSGAKCFCCYRLGEKERLCLHKHYWNNKASPPESTPDPKANLLNPPPPPLGWGRGGGEKCIHVWKTQKKSEKATTDLGGRA